MGHDHHHHHSAANGIGIAFLLNFGFTIIEFFGGYWTNSMSIISDAVHDAGDSLSLALAWGLQKYSEKQADAKYSYGYKRLTTLGALITATVLIVGLSYVLSQSISRLFDPQPVKAHGMIALAFLGVTINGIAFWKLGQGEESLNSTMAKWHLLEDALGWIAVFIGAIVIYFTGWVIIDPILSILISVFVLWNVYKGLKPVWKVFMQMAPEGFDAKKFNREVCQIDGVESVHHTHTWSLDGQSHVFTTHLVVACSTTRGDILQIKQSAKDLIASNHFDHVTIAVEIKGEPCDSE